MDSDNDLRNRDKFRCQDCYRVVYSPFVADDPVNEVCGACKPYKTQAVHWSDQILIVLSTMFFATAYVFGSGGLLARNRENDEKFVDSLIDSKGSNSTLIVFCVVLALSAVFVLFNLDIFLNQSRSLFSKLRYVLEYFGL